MDALGSLDGGGSRGEACPGAMATAAELSTASRAFPEVWKTSGLVKTMVEIDEAHEQLLAIEKAGWKPPPEHPDLVPAAVAGRLADL